MRLNKLKLALVGAATLAVGALVWNHYFQPDSADHKLAASSGNVPPAPAADLAPAAETHACGENCTHVHPEVAEIREAFNQTGGDAISARFPGIEDGKHWEGITLAKPILPREVLLAKNGDTVKLSLGDGEPVDVIIAARADRKDGARVFRMEIPETGFNLFYVEMPDGSLVGRLAKKDHPVSYRLAGTITDPVLQRVTVAEDYCSTWSREDAVVIEGIPAADPSAAPGAPVTSVAKLDSKLGSANVIYLDFDGEVVNPTSWDDGDITAVASSFTPAEIQEIWQYVSEDFRSFDVNITTDRAVFDAATIGQRMMVIFTPTDDAAPGAGGVAFLESFHNGMDEPCWVFNAGVNSAALAASHEVGHTLDLLHDGRISPAEEYYGGTAIWGPIMGAPYGSGVVHWSKGEYISANNPEDDLAIISSYIPYNADIVGNDIFSASTLTTDPDGNFALNGDIETTTDLDAYAFDTSGGSITITANPTGPTANSSGQNLNIRLRIVDSGGGTVFSSNDEALLSTTINANMVGGSYFLIIEGAAEGTWAGGGYGDYGSIGGYTITGNLPLPTPGDFDGDGLSDDEELLIGSDPYDRDTDGDGLTDRTEVYHFRAISGEYSFNGALSDALNKGGILAIMDSPEKLYRIKRGLLTTALPNPIPNNFDPTVDLADRLWIGGSDSATDGRFQWLTPTGALNGTEIGSAFLGYLTPGSNIVTNVVNVSALTSGRRISGSGIPANTSIDSVDTVARTVTLSNPVATAFNQGVGNIIIQNRGTGFMTPPLISFNPPGAVATATVALGRITSINVTNPGSYTTPPTVVITPVGGGGGASATAVLTPPSTQSRVLTITVTNGGSLYTSAPVVDIAGVGTGATAEASIDGGVVTAITVLNPGLGYTTAPTVTLIGGGGAGATATAQIVDPAARLYSPATPTTYSRWAGLLPGNRLNVPEGVAVNNGTDFYWSAVQTTIGLGYLLERPSTSPLLADTDGDGINDQLEFEQYGTNPTLADTDGDGLSDSVELFTHGTNPKLADTDGDGLTDGQEVNGLVGGYPSNPLIIDSDGDLVSDFDEVNAVPPTNPLDATSYPNGGPTIAANGLHTTVTFLGEQTVSVGQSFAPFGHRPDTDKTGDDGSVAIRDRNGAIIWVDKDGRSVVIPNSSLARTLYVTNTECVMYNNRYDGTYDARNSVSNVVIHRRAANGTLGTNVQINIPGTLVDTAPFTPNTFGFTLVAAQAFDDEFEESTERFQSGQTDDGPVFNVRSLNYWDVASYTMYRITWDGLLQTLGGTSINVIPGAPNTGSTRVIASGSDGSFIFNRTVAQNFYRDLPNGGFFNSETASYWVSFNLNSENIQRVSPRFQPKVENVGYLSNSRALLEFPITTLAPDPDANLLPVYVETGNYELQDFRQRPNGVTSIVNVFALDLGDKVLPVTPYTRAGLTPFVYTINAGRDSVKLYRVEGALSRLGAAVSLPDDVLDDTAAIRNPWDASLLLKSEGPSGILWLPSIINSVTKAVEGLAEARSLPNTTTALPMFVNNIEAVAWVNSDAPVDIGGGGVVPDAIINHFQKGDGTSVISTPLTPPIEGRYVALPPLLTPDADSEGWFVTTFEKNGDRSAVMRTYRLSLTSSADRDGDGLPDVQEIVLGTDPGNPDTDGDGITDGDEVYPFVIVDGSFTWEDARLAAAQQGGRLAVLPSTLLQNALAQRHSPTMVGKSWWIGGHDLRTEATYQWIDTASQLNGLGITSPTNWAVFQPNNIGDADALQIGNTTQQLWSMAAATKTQGYVMMLQSTNPLSSDSDGDGVPDARDRSIDTDNDGVSDFVEVSVLGTDPTIPSFGGNVNPANPPNFGSPLVNGTYIGMAFDSAGKPASTMSVAITSRAAFTANLAGVGGAGGFRGSLDVLGRYVGFVNLPGGRTRVDFNLEYDGAEWVVRGSTSNNGTILSRYELRRPIYSKSAPFAPSGRYTFAAASPSTPDTTVLGDAIGTGTISTDGVANFRGYFPDGTAWASSSRLVAGDFFALGNRTRTNPVRTMLANLRVTRATLPELSDLTGLFRIHRPTTITNTSFTRGFDQVRAAIGSTYIPPAFQQMAANWFEPYGMNSVLRFTNGGLQDTRLIGAWYPGGSLLVPNNAAYTLSGANSNLNGDVWGSYQIKTGRNTSLGIVNNKASFRGVILQKAEKVSGFYLAPASSGQIVIDPNLLGEEPDYTIVGPASMSVPGTGRNYTVSVYTQGDWEVEIPVEAAWVTAVVGGSDPAAPLEGTGDGLVSVIVARNETDVARSATIVIAGQNHTIFQAARTTTISPANKTVSAAGSTYLVGVNTIGAVTATVITGADWITATVDEATRTVSIVVAPNESTTKRVGTVNISGRIHTVTQNGVSVRISATKSPYISARGASYVVRVTADGPWTITIPVNWVTVQIDGQAAGVLTGTGNANVTVTVAPYTNASAFPVARSTTINIGGKNHAITQNWKY